MADLRVVHCTYLFLSLMQESHLVIALTARVLELVGITGRGSWRDRSTFKSTGDRLSFLFGR